MLQCLELSTLRPLDRTGERPNMLCDSLGPRNTANQMLQYVRAPGCLLGMEKGRMREGRGGKMGGKEERRPTKVALATNNHA
jgi:hypothetical protein